MEYQHTQSGKFALPVFVGLAMLLLVVISLSSAKPSGLLVMGLFLAFIGVVLLGFSQMTVTVEGDEATVRFRFGWPSRKIDLSEVHRVEAVRNKLWYGFGVRLTPQGWMYNVWGLDAVQLNYEDGKRFRIGTDQPDELLAALNKAIGAEPRIGDDPDWP